MKKNFGIFSKSVLLVVLLLAFWLLVMSGH
jgi:hypothetical protein